MRTITKKRRTIEERKQRIGYEQWLPGIHDRRMTDARIDAAIKKLEVELLADVAVEEERLGRPLTEEEKNNLQYAKMDALDAEGEE